MAEEETLFPPSRRVKSEVWKYFGYRKDAKGSLVDDNFPICKKCGRRVAAKGGNTSNMFTHLRHNHLQHLKGITIPLSIKTKPSRKTARVNTNPVTKARYLAKIKESNDIDTNSQWQQESAPYSPSSETDCSSVTQESPGSSHGWMKQEPKIEWENINSEAPTDAEQDITLSNATSTTTPTEGLPISVMLTLTKLQCLLERKQEKMEALEKQVQDLQEDRTKLQCLQESKQEKIEALEKQVQDLQEDRTKLQCLQESKQEKMEALEKQVQDLQEDRTKLQCLQESKQEKIEALEKQVQDLQKDHTKLQCLQESKQEKIEALQKQEKIDTLEKQVQDLQEDRRFLRTQIEILTSALSAYLRDSVVRNFQEK